MDRNSPIVVDRVQVSYDLREGRRRDGEWHRQREWRRATVIVVLIVSLIILSILWSSHQAYKENQARISRDLQKKLATAEGSLASMRNNVFFEHFAAPDLGQIEQALAQVRQRLSVEDLQGAQQGLESVRTTFPRATEDVERSLQSELTKPCPSGHKRRPEFKFCPVDGYRFEFWKSGNTVYWLFHGKNQMWRLGASGAVPF